GRRTGPPTEPPPPQALAGPRPDQSAPLAPGGGRVGADRGPAAGRGRAGAAAVGALLAALGLGRVPEGVPGRAGHGRAAAGRPRPAAAAVRLLPAGMEHLRPGARAGTAVGESRVGPPECASIAGA